MRRFTTAACVIALAGCAGMDWDAEDKRVGYTREAGQAGATSHVDPVNGQDVTADSPWRMEHEGRTYYFSDRESYEAFRQNPAQYAGQAEVR